MSSSCISELRRETAERRPRKTRQGAAFTGGKRDMGSDKDLVSIITPCYNGAEFLPETAQSVLSQTWRDFEWIIIDDGSKDDSAAIAQGFADADGRVRLIRQENAGSAAARNHGIREAKGRYIALLDADDLWDPEFLAEQVAFMRGSGASLVCCSYRFIDEDGNETGKPVICRREITLKDMLVKNEIGCLTGLYDTACGGKLYLDESLRSVRDDYAYWIDAVRAAGRALGNQKVLASYRVRRGSVTGNKRKLIGKQYAFYRNYLGLSVPVSLLNLMRWGIAGIKKFHS